MSDNSIVTNKHHHIDNGGPSIELTTDENGYTCVEFEADYYGLPSVSSKIYVGDDINILLMFKRAIEEHIAKINLLKEDKDV